MSKWGTLASRYSVEKPRKLLALDGGGIRGVLSLEILLELETQLKKELGRDDSFRLSDYFDYIAGTSTGAIIAAGLSIGMSVSELLSFYEKKGKLMFNKASFFKKAKVLYKHGPLTEELKKVFGEGNIDLKDGKFLSLLLVITMNRTTDSPWPISNNPYAKYNNSTRPDCNLQIPLYKLIRASTAAPWYFAPEELQWDENDQKKTFVFVDGGTTPYNNPAFLLYRMATQAPYGLKWKTGEKEMLIVSVGTGAASRAGLYKNILTIAKKLATDLMHTTAVDQDINCRTVGRCVFGAPIERELGGIIPLDEEGNILSLESDAGRHFSYVRYNADLSEEGLAALGLSKINSENIQEMDSVENIKDLRNVGKLVGQQQVKVAKHFRFFLDKT